LQTALLATQWNADPVASAPGVLIGHGFRNPELLHVDRNTLAN
jgi:hypothetical protein